MLYAAYGSNLHPARLRARVVTAHLMGVASMSGWALCFNKRGGDGSAKCNIVLAKSEIHVAIYELDASGKAMLDAIEGVGGGYRAVEVDVAGYGSCHTYVADHGHIDNGLQPYTWYKELVLAGCTALTFPADYIATIRAVQARRDPDRRRDAVNRSLVDLAKRVSARV